MQGDDPPFLPVGTDVSAKYKGAFCEAKVRKVVRNIKCKVTLKGGGITTVNDDVIKGTLRVGSTVEVKQDPKKDAIEAVITKIQDCSQYTVVFDDGDITTLRRSALCLKSGRHFNESETLDQLPLTHPEHFSTPVIAGRRGRRGRAQSDESEGEGGARRVQESSAEREPHVGRVVLVEAAGGAERRRPQQPAFPALVVAPTAQIKVKDDYLVRSFKDGRYYTVPKKEAREFRKGAAPLEWCGVEAALQYLNHGELPPHWDRDALFNEPRNTSDDSSDDEPREEKDHFVAQLYKFMDDRGTPLNRNPTIANRDIDLYRLFRVVQKSGGYNRVTNQNQWKTIADKMGFHPVTTSITNLCKQAYKKFLHSFEDFYRKLGVTLVAHPRGARTPPAGRSLIRDRDKLPPATSSTSASASSTPTSTPSQRGKDKDSDKSETEKSDKSEKEDKIEKPEKKDKPRASDEDDSADNQPLVTTAAAAAAPKVEKEKEKEKDTDKDKDKEKPKEKEREKEKEKSSSPSVEKAVVKPRSQSKTRSLPPIKTESHEKRTPKRKALSSKLSETAVFSVRASRRPHVSTDSDSSGRASRCGPMKKMQIRRSQSANSASSGNTVASNSSKRPRKRKTTEPSTSESTRPAVSNVKAQVGDKLKVYYGPTQSESKVTYEAKVIEISAEGMLRVHYTGWNTRYDEWIKPQRIALNVTQHETRNKKVNIKYEAKVIEISAEGMLRVHYTGWNTRYDEWIKPQRIALNVTQHETRNKKVNIKYEAKVIEISAEGMLRVHYTGWNTRYDEWIKPQRIALNVTQHETRNKKGTNLSRRVRSKRTEESSARSDTDSDSDSDASVKRPPKKLDDKASVKTPSRSRDSKDLKSGERSDSSSSNKPRKRPVRTVSTPLATSPAKKPRLTVTGPQHQGRDYDLNEIRSELKGLHSVKQEADENKTEIAPKDMIMTTTQTTQPPPEPPQPEKQPEDVYEFKEPEPFELELHDEKKKRTHRIFDDISPSKYTSTLSKSLSEEISEDSLRPRPSTFRSPSLSPFRDFGGSRDVSGRQSPDDDFKDNLFSLDDDSFPGDSNSGPIFEGFTPAKNQETYSKKSKVSKLKEIIDDSPDSPADDEQSSDDDSPEDTVKEEREPSPIIPVIKEIDTAPEPVKVEPKIPEPTKEVIKDVIKEPIKIIEELPLVAIVPEPPKTPPPKAKPETFTLNPSTNTTVVSKEPEEKKDEKDSKEIDKTKETPIVIPPLSVEAKELPKIKIDKADPGPTISKIELPSSPLIDTEEDKSEPDSPARIDVLPEPPPGFLLQSEGPKIAEKLLKAINSAKRLSMSPPPVENRPETPKKEIKAPDAIDKPASSPVPIEPKRPPSKTDLLKPLNKLDHSKRLSPSEITDSIFGEPSNLTDVKKDTPDIKKVKPKEPTPPRLLSPLNILERRKSIAADLPLSAPGKNKVLSETIQKLSSQINQSVTASIPLPPFPSEDRSESSDSDDSDRRLIIDKLSAEEWGGTASAPLLARAAASARALHAGKSPGEWSAGESLLMLEDACKNERKHSASVVVAGGVRCGGAPAAAHPAGGGAEDDSCVSLLLCEETIPGSPAPDAEPPPARAHHSPFASAPQHQHNHHALAHHAAHNHKAEERRGPGGQREAGAGAGGHEAEGSAGDAGAAAGADAVRLARGDEWSRRRALLDNTPPTSPDSSVDLSPRRERRISERDSPSDRKDDEDDNPAQDACARDIDKSHGSMRSRKASESSGAGRGRARRARRDTDEHAPHSSVSLKYNFYVELDPSWDCQTRINVLSSRLADLRKAYHSVKAELAAIDRRRKKLRRKEREAIKAAKAACS